MEWNDEPDSKEWTDEATGLECRIRRTPGLGVLCGYVRIPDGHPWHGVHYDNVYDTHDVEVHGGLTFAANQEDPSDWWLGFDCAHSGDFSPGIDAGRGWTPDLGGPGGTYRNMAYVTAEVESLAKQAIGAA